MKSAAVVAPGAKPLEDRYRELFEGTLLALYMSRPDGSLVTCNAAFATLLGFASTADAVAAGASAVYADEGERDRFLERVQALGRLEHYRGRMRCVDGGVIDVIETVVGQFDRWGRLEELSGFLIDVTATARVVIEVLA